VANKNLQEQRDAIAMKDRELEEMKKETDMIQQKLNTSDLEKNHLERT
jgi:hypothetical protein